VRAVKFNPPIGEPPAVQFHRPDQLQVDASYQRGVESRRSQLLIQAIAANWDWRLCTPLLVASRAGALYIIDGQHRWEAARLRGDIPFLPCAVGQYDGAAAEAALFVAANLRRVRVNPCDMWRAAVAAGDRATATLERLVTAAGFAIASSPQNQNLKPGELLCTKALYTALRVHGEAAVEQVLALMAGAFNDQVISHSGLIFAACLHLVTGEPVEGDLASALAASSADEWATHPALTGLVGASNRAAALRKLILEVMTMLEDDEEAEAA
jgi:hypothetical protein